jgi:hypothetical protein
MRESTANTAHVLDNKAKSDGRKTVLNLIRSILHYKNIRRAIGLLASLWVWFSEIDEEVKSQNMVKTTI